MNQEKTILHKILQTSNVVTDVSENLKQVSSKIVLIAIPEVHVCFVRGIPRHKEARRLGWGIVNLYVTSRAADFVYGLASAYGAAIGLVLKFSPARFQHLSTVLIQTLRGHVESRSNVGIPHRLMEAVIDRFILGRDPTRLIRPLIGSAYSAELRIGEDFCATTGTELDLCRGYCRWS